MKIEQLLELAPAKQIPAAAQALKDRRVARTATPVANNPAANTIPQVKSTLPQATSGVGAYSTQAAKAATPAATAPTAEPAQVATPAANATDPSGRIEPTLDAPDELAAIKKNAGIAQQEPEAGGASAFGQMAGNLAGDKTTAPDVAAQGNTVTHNATADNPNVKPAEPGALKKAWDYANSDQSGEDAAKFGRGMADAGAGLAGAAGGAIRHAGNIAAQTAGGITQTAGAALGGAVHGYEKARQGGKFGSTIAGIAQGDSPYPSAPSAGGGSSGGAGGAGGQEIAQLKAAIKSMDDRLQSKGI